MHVEDIQQLIRKLRASDRDAFKSVFEQYQDSIFRFLYYKTRDAQLSEDLLQEAFLKLWNAREQLDEKQSLTNYLYTIAANLVVNHVRHMKVVAAHQEQANRSGASNVNNPQFILEEQEWKASLEKAIDALPDQARIVFLMSRMEDLSYKEIAERLGLSVKTVESHMTKALGSLREVFSKKI